ncbi:MAG: sulfate ABC transporter permease subunit [Megasphaera sp.]|jgi:sulfate transport system permease protein|nr:sulfate ABC transporter permease subunit [Megasphaera sp.]
MKRDLSKYILLSISIVFVMVMLILPLFSVLYHALQQGLAFYKQALTTPYVLSALRLTLLAAVIAVSMNTLFGLLAAWTISNYDFSGKHFLTTLIDIPFSISPVIAGLAFIMTFGRMGWASGYVEAFNTYFGTDIQIVFAVPGVVLATMFVTFPFVFREILPVLTTNGKEEEEAAALMGASGFSIFRHITLPQIKWALLYGIILCTARALGEFGAVAALSKTRGQTFTLPLEIDALYQSGSADSITAAFAVSSLLVFMALGVLILRTIIEYKTNHHTVRKGVQHVR